MDCGDWGLIIGVYFKLIIRYRQCHAAFVEIVDCVQIEARLPPSVAWKLCYLFYHDASSTSCIRI